MIKRWLGKAAVALLFLVALPVMAGAQETRPHFITVNSTGSVLARPDLGILVMAVQSSAPLAADAITENAKKVKAVQAAIEGLGYSSKNYKIAPAVLSPAGGPYYAPGQPSITGILASQFVYVFFEGAELNDAELNQKSASAVDALIKAGAVPSVGPFRSTSQPRGTLIVYTIKDPSGEEAQALQNAMGDDRAKAEQIASHMHVQITGLVSINSFVRSSTQQLSGRLEDLPYRYYSTEGDEVKISETVTLAYTFK
jgi:uncharacterized protein